MTAESSDNADTKEVQHLVLYSSFTYGAGMALGFLLIFLLLVSPILDWIVDLIDAQQPFVKILVGLLLFLGTVGLGGAVAGAWGALRDAIVENDITLRVMMEESAMNGIENRAGIRWLQRELEAAGKEDNLDLRFSAHKMHNKGMLVDKEFLSVGSQNFHYSAWGAPSLTEYNLATDDPQAVEEFLTEYEYWWNLALPVEDVMGQDDVLAGLRGK